MTHTLTQADLRHFTGSETWYRHALVRDILYTEGGAIRRRARRRLLASRRDRPPPEISARNCRRSVNADRSATLSCTDGDCKTIFEKKIELTDFPLEEIAFYVVDKTILLPSEY